MLDFKMTISQTSTDSFQCGRNETEIEHYRGIRQDITLNHLISHVTATESFVILKESLPES